MPRRDCSLASKGTPAYGMKPGGGMRLIAASQVILRRPEGGSSFIATGRSPHNPSNRRIWPGLSLLTLVLPGGYQRSDDQADGS